MRPALTALALALAAACSPVEIPLVFATTLSDTTDALGPYPVEARVSARRSIASVELVWHNAAVGPGQAERGLMVQDAQTGVYRALLPGLGRGATIAYHVEATDSQGDTGFWPPGSETGTRCGDEVCFQILPRP